MRNCFSRLKALRRIRQLTQDREGDTFCFEACPCINTSHKFMSDHLYFKFHGQLGRILYKSFKTDSFLSRDPKQCQCDNFQYSSFGHQLASQEK